MNKKFLIITLGLLFSICSLSAAPKREYWNIQNNLEKEVEISSEYKFDHENISWSQNILELPVHVSGFLSDSKVEICESGDKDYFLSFFPVGPVADFIPTRDYLLSQPVSAKMRDIFASFEVYDENGRLLFDLDSLEKVHIEIEKEDRIIFVVGDYLYD